MKNQIMSTKKSVMSNMLWRFAERGGAQGVSFIVSVILARLLSPDDYGLIALITVFTSLLQVFVDSGLGTALIQKKDADDLDFSTVFYFNIIFCILMYVLLYVCAPWIAVFYAKPELIKLIRVIGLTIVISGVSNIQQSYVSKRMIFKKFFYVTLSGTILSAVVGITMAYRGFGVWSLVGQSLANSIVNTLFLWGIVKWRPKKQFSWERLKGLWSFGWKMLCARLLETLYQDVRQLIIGKLYTSSDLAYYNRGKQIPNLIVTNINASIDSVLLPVMSQAQDDAQRLKMMVRRSIKTSTFIVMPMMLGLAACADSIVVLLLTEKWIECVPFMVVFCVINAMNPIHTANLNAIKALGRSDLFLKLEIVKKIVGITLLLISMKQGVLAMAFSLLVSTLLSVMINVWPNKKLLRYGLCEQLKDIAPSCILSVCMCGIVRLVGYLDLPLVLVLILQVLSGCAFYIAGALVVKMDAFQYMLDLAKEYIKKK